MDNSILLALKRRIPEPIKHRIKTGRLFTEYRSGFTLSAIKHIDKFKATTGDLVTRCGYTW